MAVDTLDQATVHSISFGGSSTGQDMVSMVLGRYTSIPNVRPTGALKWVQLHMHSQREEYFAAIRH